MPRYGSIPFAPTSQYQPDSSSITDLILRAGDIQARRAQEQGQILGSTVAGLGNLAAETLERHQETKQRQKTEAAWSDYLDNGDWHSDPLEAYKTANKIWGAEEGPKHFEGLMAVQKLAQGDVKDPQKAEEYLGHVAQTANGMSDEMLTRYWPHIRAAAKSVIGDIGESFDPAFRPQIKEIADRFSTAEKKGEAFTLGAGQVRYSPTGEEIARGPAPEAKPDTRGIDTLIATETDPARLKELLARKRLMAEAERAPGTATTAKPGTFEGYLLSKYGPNPTPDQILQAKGEFEQAGKPKTGEGPKPLSGEASAKLAIATELKKNLTTLHTMIDVAPRATAYGAAAPALLGGDPGLQRLIDNTSDQIGRLRSGGSINKDEEARFRGLLTKASDVIAKDPKGALVSIESLLSEVETVANAIKGVPQGTAGGGGGGGQKSFNVGRFEVTVEP